MKSVQQKGKEKDFSKKVGRIPEKFQDKISLVRETLCPEATDDELTLFFHACERTGLDPLMKQIYPVKRWSNALGRNAMTIQTGIDGYRLIAERTGKYSPGRDTEYKYKDESKLPNAARAYVKKLTPDGTWHEVSATAYWDEYVQKTKQGGVTKMWREKPHIMLGKCAEALALRKSFPAELSGLYTSEEMSQADVIDISDNFQNKKNKSNLSDSGVTNKSVISKTPPLQKENFLNDNQIREIKELSNFDNRIMVNLLKKYSVNNVLQINQKYAEEILVKLRGYRIFLKRKEERKK